MIWDILNLIDHPCNSSNERSISKDKLSFGKSAISIVTGRLTPLTENKYVNDDGVRVLRQTTVGEQWRRSDVKEEIQEQFGSLDCSRNGGDGK